MNQMTCARRAFTTSQHRVQVAWPVLVQHTAMHSCCAAEENNLGRAAPGGSGSMPGLICASRACRSRSAARAAW